MMMEGEWGPIRNEYVAVFFWVMQICGTHLELVPVVDTVENTKRKKKKILKK